MALLEDLLLRYREPSSRAPGLSERLAAVLPMLAPAGGGGGGGGAPAALGGGGFSTAGLGDEFVTGPYGVTLTAEAMAALKEARRRTGLPIFANVVSSTRSREEQQRLYNLWLAGKGNLAAAPGTSKHESGLALDISSAWLARNPIVKQVMQSLGWSWNVPGEPWHAAYLG